MNTRFLRIRAMDVALLVSLLALLLPAVAAETPKEVEWVMTLGCRHCHFGEQTGITTCKGNCGPAAVREGSVYQLTGNAVPKDFKKSGQWLVKGTVAADGKTIAVSQMAAKAP